MPLSAVLVTTSVTLGVERGANPPSTAIAKEGTIVLAVAIGGQEDRGEKRSERIVIVQKEL
jgi:hypothetical protein